MICGWASSSWNFLSTHTCSTFWHHEPIKLCSYIQGVSNPLDSCLPAPGTVSLQRKHGFTAMLSQIPSRRTTTTVLFCLLNKGSQREIECERTSGSPKLQGDGAGHSFPHSPLSKKARLLRGQRIHRTSHLAPFAWRIHVDSPVTRPFDSEHLGGPGHLTKGQGGHNLPRRQLAVVQTNCDR